MNIIRDIIMSIVVIIILLFLVGGVFVMGYMMVQVIMDILGG